MPPEKPRVLFVDDEQELLDGLRNALFRERKRWAMRFACGAQAGLDALEEHGADIVVSDMRMPQMDGAQFLTIVKDRYPEAIRFVLTGQADEAMTLRALPVAHHWLHKPCGRDSLVAEIERGLSALESIEDPAMRTLCARLDDLPMSSQAIQRLQVALAHPETSTAEIAELVSSEPGLAVRVLQFVNSAAFGVSSPVADMELAVKFLGVEMLSRMAVTEALFRFDDKLPPRARALHGRLTERSQVAAAVAAEIAEDFGADSSAVLGALLAEVGRIAMLREGDGPFLQAYERVMGQCAGLEATEETEFGVEQEALGAAVLSRWGLPLKVTEPIRFQGKPQEAPEGSQPAATVIRFASLVAFATQAEGADADAADGARHGIEPERLELFERLVQDRLDGPEQAAGEAA